MNQWRILNSSSFQTWHKPFWSQIQNYSSYSKINQQIASHVIKKEKSKPCHFLFSKNFSHSNKQGHRELLDKHYQILLNNILIFSTVDKLNALLSISCLNQSAMTDFNELSTNRNVQSQFQAISHIYILIFCHASPTNLKKMGKIT